jgi:hypothetical protein
MSSSKSAHLIVPSIRARPDLNALLHLVRPAQEVPADLLDALWLGVVEADDEEGGVDDSEAGRVVLFGGEASAEGGPDFAVLGGEDADGSFGDLR